MQMIGHDNKGVQLETGINVGEILPRALNNFSCRVELHFRLGDMSEKEDIFVGVDGDELHPWLAVVIVFQARGGFSDGKVVGHVIIGFAGGEVFLSGLGGQVRRPVLMVIMGLYPGLRINTPGFVDRLLRSIPLGPACPDPVG